MAAKKRAEPTELNDDDWLSQYGEKPPGEPFRDRLRVELGETEISMIFGRVTAEQASLIVRQMMHPLRDVRVTTVEALRRSGFRVYHSPTTRSALHVSVHPPGTDVDWDDAVASRFTACFELGSMEEMGGAGR